MRANPTSANKSDIRWAVWVSIGIVALSCVPYIIGYALVPAGFSFIGTTFNTDDALVYLSWMRQAADGHFFIRNLFTTEPQVGHGFNIFFLFLGTFARVTHLPLIAVFHLARILSAIGLLLAVYGVSGVWLKETWSRRVALLIVGLSSGLGWLFGAPPTAQQPVDNWQPEAFTFLSIYLSPLFVFPTLLMLAALHFMLQFARTGRWKHAVSAGVVLLVLANIHGYDLITIGIAWALYSAYQLVRKRGARPVVVGLTAALIASPAVIHQVLFYRGETIFRERVATATLSVSPVWYLLGYGLLLPLALYGIWRARRERNDVSLLVCWAAAGFVAAYLPIAFQRKLIMGTHIPLALLASLGVVSLVGHLRARQRAALAGFAILLMVPSNLCFMARDIARLSRNESNTTAHVPFLAQEELAALSYLRTETKPDDVILAPCGFAVLVPGYSDRQVYYGHWGETVGFREKLLQAMAVYAPSTDDQARRDLLMSTGITYVIGYHIPDGVTTRVIDFDRTPVPYLSPAYSNDALTVFRVNRLAL